MEQAEVKYAPGMRIIVRGEEWMVKKVETNSLGNQTLYVIGLSQLVKDYESMFLVDVENDIEIVDPAKVTLVPDDSAFFRKSKVYIESQWRSKIPTDNKIHIGNKAAMDLMSYQLEPAQMALNKTIFTERIETMKYLAENLKKDLGLKDNQLEVMHGGMSDKELQRIVDEFGRAESPIRVIVASDVASEGINLHYLSHRLIHFDIPWSLMVFQQRNGRVMLHLQEQERAHV